MAIMLWSVMCKCSPADWFPRNLPSESWRWIEININSCSDSWFCRISNNPSFTIFSGFFAIKADVNRHSWSYCNTIDSSVHIIPKKSYICLHNLSSKCNHLLHLWHYFSADLTKASYFSTTCHIETTFLHPVNSQWTKTSRFSLGNTPHYKIKYPNTIHADFEYQAGVEKLESLCIYITFCFNNVLCWAAWITFECEICNANIVKSYESQQHCFMLIFCLYTALVMMVLLKSFYTTGNISISAVRISKNLSSIYLMFVDTAPYASKM